MSKPTKSTAIASSSLIGPLMLVSKSMRSLMSAKLERLGLWPGQDEILLALELGSQTVGMIAERVNVRPSTVSKSLEQLLGMGFVTKCEDPTDRRRSTVTLTPSGEDMTRRIRALYAELNSDFGKRMEREQFVAASQLLDQIHAHLMKTLSRHR